MKELTQAQKALAFDLWISFKEAGHGDYLTEQEFENLCFGLGVAPDYSSVARLAVGKYRFDLMSAVKYAVAAPPKAFPATISDYEGTVNCANCGCKYYDMIDGIVVCNECLKVAK
jgi:hypothetical protein